MDKEIRIGSPVAAAPLRRRHENRSTLAKPVTMRVSGNIMRDSPELLGWAAISHF
jgi:hypothetical protein